MELFQQCDKVNNRLLNGEVGLNANARPVANRHVGMSRYIFGIYKKLWIKSFYGSNDWKDLLTAYSFFLIIIGRNYIVLNSNSFNFNSLRYFSKFSIIFSKG